MVQTILKSHNIEFAVKKDLIAALLHKKKTKNIEHKENLTLKELINRGS